MLACLGGTLLAAPRANADDLDATREQVTERTKGYLSVLEALRAGESGLRLRLEPALVSSGKFDGARIGWWRTGISVAGGLPLSERATLGISPSFAYEQLVSKRSDDFIISAEGRDSDVADFIDAALNIGADYRFDGGFGAEIATRASVRQELGAAFDEALQIGGSLAGTYRYKKWLRLRLGVGLGTDIGDGKFRISPVYRIIIKPLGDLTLESSGLGGSAEWQATKKLALILSGGVDGTQYKLKRRARPPAGLGDGSLQRRQTEIVLGAVYRARKWLRIAADLGFVVAQELQVLDQRGRVVDERTDDSLSPSFRLRFEFRI